MLEEIPLTRPDTPLLDQIGNPSDLKLMEINQLSHLADELRLFLVAFVFVEDDESLAVAHEQVKVCVAVKVAEGG